MPNEREEGERERQTVGDREVRREIGGERKIERVRELASEGARVRVRGR